MEAGLTDSAIAVLEQRVLATPDDGDAHYQLAVFLLAAHADSYYYRKAATLQRARKLLNRAVELQPSKANRHALLGFVLSHRKQDHSAAIESFRRALRLNPKDKIVQVFIVALLAEMGREREALEAVAKAARAQKVNLATHRAALRKARMPSTADNMLQAFIRPRNFFVSSLWREAERLRKKVQPAAHNEGVRAERDECVRRQRELKGRFDSARVPPPLRALASAAARYGVGDDVCRPLLMKRMSKKTRERLDRDARELAEPIAKWLDGFAAGAMSDEAAAYMYLLEGLDELRGR